MQMHVQMTLAAALCREQDMAIATGLSDTRTPTEPMGTAMTLPSAELALVRGSDWPWLQSAAQMAWRACRNWPPRPADNWTVTPRVATRTPAPETHSIAAARAFAIATTQRW